MRFHSLEELLLTLSDHIFEYELEGKVIYFGIQFAWNNITIFAYVSEEKKEERWYYLHPNTGKIFFFNDFKYGYSPIIKVYKDSLIDQHLHRIIK